MQNKQEKYEIEIEGVKYESVQDKFPNDCSRCAFKLLDNGCQTAVDFASCYGGKFHWRPVKVLKKPEVTSELKANWPLYVAPTSRTVIQKEPVKTLGDIIKTYNVESTVPIVGKIEFSGAIDSSPSAFTSIAVDSSKVPVVNVPNQEVRVTNAVGGVKADGAKLRPTLLLRSMPDAVQAVIRILDYGAKKYSDDNWKKVEAYRYDDAALRHILSYLAGETTDSESSENHLAHAITCLLFRLQLDISEAKKVDNAGTPTA